MFSVEKVNRLTLSGVPFRDAYKQVGLEIEAGNFIPDKHIRHTHEGSMGCLCNDAIASLMKEIIQGFAFEKANVAERKLMEFSV